MSISPITQMNLYSHDKILISLIDLYKKEKLPNKILFSGQKGIGKSTLAYHLINYILSQGEEFSYNLENFNINENNKSYKLTKNKTNPNFSLIDVLDEKKKIDINQIRDLIKDLNKSSFNNKPRFVLIDNIELLNINSINSLLKTLEEPGHNIFFVLINNNMKILQTLKSRCLNFNISLTNHESLKVCKNLINNNVYDVINRDLLNYYMTPGKIYYLVNFSKENDIDLKNVKLDELLSILINKTFYKNQPLIKNYIFEFIEFFIFSKISSKSFDLYNYFVKRINDTIKFNLNEESLFLEFKEKFLNG